MNKLSNSPLDSLVSHKWFKLICGASYQHLPAIRNLALVYTLAGADCIDTAPDPAVIKAASEGINVAVSMAKAIDWLEGNYSIQKPLLMVSFNAGEDPHFRKAVFDPETCPPDCDRPCVSICPAHAIAFTPDFQGVRANWCYGCGRCLPICPYELVYTREHIYTVEAIQHEPIDAIEIHTRSGQLAEFQDLWQRIIPLIAKLKLIAVSFPDDDHLQDFLESLLEFMQPRPSHLIWQTDGRPMSGDIGKGTTRAALLLGQKVLNLGLPMGFVQIAGGTNASTVPKLKALGIDVAGVAYGSYARQLLADILEEGGDRLEQYPHLLKQAVTKARQLVGQIKDVTKDATKVLI